MQARWRYFVPNLAFFGLRRPFFPKYAAEGAPAAIASTTSGHTKKKPSAEARQTQERPAM